MKTNDIKVGSHISDNETGLIYEVVTLQGYVNYGVGIEQEDRENADTEYIKVSDIGKTYRVL